jgi:GT2 family glycosyltransferase
MIDVSICVVNWNTAAHLQCCLQSIFEHPWSVVFEVIVVDNASKDESLGIVHREFPQVKVIANMENVGFARANNQAFDIAEGRYLLLLNSDTVVLPESLDKMVKFMDQNLEAGLIGCMLLNVDGSLQRSCWRDYPTLKTAVIDAFYLWRLMPNLPMVRASELSCQELQNTIEVDHVLGACMLVRREILNSVGGLNEKFFLYSEETEWCYRIKKSGWKIYFIPHAKIVHCGQQSTYQNPEHTLPEKYHNYLRFYREFKHPSRFNELLLKGVFLLGSMIRIGLWTWKGFQANQRTLANRMRSGYWKVLTNVWWY